MIAAVSHMQVPAAPMTSPVPAPEPDARGLFHSADTKAPSDDLHPNPQSGR